MKHEDIRVGDVDDPGMIADVDQTRAEILDKLRTATAVSVTWLDEGDHTANHIAFGLNAPPFLLLAAVRAWGDLRHAIVNDDIILLGVFFEALNRADHLDQQTGD